MDQSDPHDPHDPQSDPHDPHDPQSDPHQTLLLFFLCSFCSFCSFFLFFSSFVPVGPQKDNRFMSRDPCILPNQNEKMYKYEHNSLCPHLTLHHRGVRTTSNTGATNYI